MTVLENVMLAPTGQPGERFWANWLRPGAVAAQERAHARRGAATGSTSSAWPRWRGSRRACCPAASASCWSWRAC